MQQIADWLEKLGMSEYAQRFAESDIDIDVLGELTDQDFDRLGVSLGHRRRMLRAIRELGASPIAAVTERQAPVPTGPEPAPKDSAERRQSHGNVLGPSRFDGPISPHGPRGPSRGHLVLSEMRRGDRATLRRLRRKIH